MEAKAKDLRIGNWIYEPECEPYYFQVEELKKYVGSEIWVHYRKGSIKAKEVQPIPLDESILLKCPQFERVSKNAWFVGLFGEISIHINSIDGRLCLDTKDDYLDELCVIKELHRFQNFIFALTQTELEINL